MPPFYQNGTKVSPPRSRRHLFLGSTISICVIYLLVGSYQDLVPAHLGNPVRPQQLAIRKSRECENPFLRHVAPQKKQRLEELTIEWYNNLPDIVHSISMHGEPQAHKRHDCHMPIMEDFGPMTRVGGDGDGGKILCGFEALKEEEGDKCVVYSLGSAGDWSFEEAVAKLTQCTIHTFDCTIQVRPPDSIKGRAFFHPICIGSKVADDWRTLPQLMAELNHTSLSLLKVDIESSEYDLFQSILPKKAPPGQAAPQEAMSELPMQISFELHAHNRLLSDMVVLWERLFDAGYRAVSREDNLGCDLCTEFTIIRTVC